MGNIIFSKELVSHREIDFKICTLLYTLYTFFMSKVRVPHLKIAVHFCTLLYTFDFSFASKVLVPHLNFMAQTSMFSVHFCTLWLVQICKPQKPASSHESAPCSQHSLKFLRIRLLICSVNRKGVASNAGLSLNVA